MAKSTQSKLALFLGALPAIITVIKFLSEILKSNKSGKRSKKR